MVINFTLNWEVSDSVSALVATRIPVSGLIQKNSIAASPASSGTISYLITSPWKYQLIGIFAHAIKRKHRGNRYTLLFSMKIFPSSKDKHQNKIHSHPV